MKILILLLFITSLISLPIDSRPVNISSRVRALVANMTIEEKVGQLTQLDISMLLKDNTYYLDAEKMNYAFGVWKVGSIFNSPFAGGTVQKKIGFNATEFLNFTNTIQQYALKHMQIPMIYGLDSVHGANYIYGATMFPQNLCLAGSFNTTNAYLVGRTAGRDTRAGGVPWIFGPVTGLGVNPLWSRIYETFGEDPVLVGAMSSNVIKGIQQNGNLSSETAAAACLKHYMGYSDPVSGKDRTTAWIPLRQLLRYFLPPFREGVQAGAATVMANSGSVDGIPVHSSYEILTGLLRDDLNFTGMVVTDYQDLEKLTTFHQVAENYKIGAQMGLEAGIDMSMVPVDYSFGEDVLELWKEGKISMNRIDMSVQRIVQLKENLGLLDNPYGNPKNPALGQIGSERELAVEMARESIVLGMNNGTVLPLKNGTYEIFLTGPTARNISTQAGGWSVHWQGARAEEFAYGTSVYDGMQQVLKQYHIPANLTYTRGCEFDYGTKKELQETLARAKTADYIVLCLGEESEAEQPGDTNSLFISDPQLRLYQSICENSPSVPLVVVMIGSRPRIVPNVINCAKAFIWASLPGPDGGLAIAEILLGITNPSGKMPLQYPQYSGDINVPYYHGYSDVTYPLFSFGHGLSYTTFSYSISIKNSTVELGKSVELFVNLTNTGSRTGAEVIMVFLSDLYASVRPEVAMLKAFTKVILAPGAKFQTSFVITPEQMSFIGRDLKPTIEKGSFTLRAGNQAVNFELV